MGFHARSPPAITWQKNAVYHVQWVPQSMIFVVSFLSDSLDSRRWNTETCALYICAAETKALVTISTLNTVLEVSQKGRCLQAAHRCVDISLQTVVWVTSATILLWCTTHHELAVKLAWHHVSAPCLLSNTSVLGGSTNCWLLYEAVRMDKMMQHTYGGDPHLCLYRATHFISSLTWSAKNNSDIATI